VSRVIADASLVNFPSVRPGKNTPYTIYTRDPGSSASLSEQRTLLVGETEDIEFFSTNRLEHKEGEGSDCQCAIP
jgi:DNA-directed RNA polymerase I subunit RPA49